MSERGLYYGSAHERMREPCEDSTTHKLKNAYWTTKQVVIRKFGRREDEHVVASDSELDAKLELFQSIQKTCMDLMRIIERYQDKICMLSQAENELGRFLKNQGAEDKTRAGKMMSAVGKSLSFSAQQRLALRVPLSRLQQEVETFRYRAISDTLQTVSTMEQRRTEYRAALLWMRDASEQLDPDTYKQMDKFRKVQAQVRKTKTKFDKLKLDSMQKVDLLAASRCNMFSHVLSLYQTTLLQFWEKTCRTMVAVADSFQGYQYYEFSMLKDLTDESRKLAQLTRHSAAAGTRAIEDGSAGGGGADEVQQHSQEGKEETDMDALDRRLEDIFAASDGDPDSDIKAAIESNNRAPSSALGTAHSTAAAAVGKTVGANDSRQQQDSANADILDLGFHDNESEHEAADKAFMEDFLAPSGERPMSIFDDFIGQHGGGDASKMSMMMMEEGAASSRPDWASLFGGDSSLLEMDTGTGTGRAGTAPTRAPPSAMLAGIMPSALLDHRAQLANMFDPLSTTPGGTGSTARSSMGASGTSKTTAPGSGAGSMGIDSGTGKGSNSAAAAWISMFADLDPLANPDSISKKEGQITDT